MAGLERPWALGCAPGFHLSDKYLLCSRPRFHTEGKMVERTRGFCPFRVCILVRRPRKQNKAPAAFVTHDRLGKSPGKRRGVRRIRKRSQAFQRNEQDDDEVVREALVKEAMLKSRATLREAEGAKCMVDGSPSRHGKQH